MSSLFVNCSQIGTQFDWSTNQLVPQFRKIWRSLPGPMDAIFVAHGVSEFIRHSVGDFCSSTRLKFWEDCIALGAFYKPLSINIIFVIILPVKDDLLHKTFFGCKADLANTLLEDHHWWCYRWGLTYSICHFWPTPYLMQKSTCSTFWRFARRSREWRVTDAGVREKMFIWLNDWLNAMHNVYMRDYDSPVYKIALYMLQGNNRISMYICRILALFPWNLVVATGEYLRENHEFRVWGSRKLKFTHVPPDWTTWDKYMFNGIKNVTF